MANDILLALILGVIFGCIFFIVDIYNEIKTNEINTSLIAGVTITYFFIILLPEIQTGLEEAHLGIYQFIGILIGFGTIHLTEKFILLRVEKKSQIKLKEICEQEAKVLEREKSVEKSLIDKLVEKDPASLSREDLIEKLSALEEIRTIQDLWVEEEIKLRRKMLRAELNKFSYLNILSAIKEVSKIQYLCLTEEWKLEDSIRKRLQKYNKENPSFEKLGAKLHALEELRQKEIENVEKKKNVVEILIKSLMADSRDKIPKEKFTEKLLALDKSREMLADYIKDEYKMGKVIIEETRNRISEKRATKNLYALEVCRKITEACTIDEMILEKKLMEVGQNNLMLLARLSSLKQINRIRMKSLEEVNALEKKLIEKDKNIFTEKNLTEKFNALREVFSVQKENLLKQKNLEQSLINKLMKNDAKDILSIEELNEKLSELKRLGKVQEDCIEKEKSLENTLIFNIKTDESEKLTLEELASTLDKFCQREEEFEAQDYALRVKIQNHINEHLDELHIYTNFIYHLLIGIILFELLTYEFITGILFFVFALFKAITSKTSNDIQLFTGIEINKEHHEPLYLKIVVASSALIGVFVGFLLYTIFHVSIVIIFLLFSFISGVILYTIIREVLPENESGRPLYFLLGIIIFLVFIITFESVSTLFSGGH